MSGKKIDCYCGGVHFDISPDAPYMLGCVRNALKDGFAVCLSPEQARAIECECVGVACTSGPTPSGRFRIEPIPEKVDMFGDEPRKLMDAGYLGGLKTFDLTVCRGDHKPSYGYSIVAPEQRDLCDCGYCGGGPRSYLHCRREL